MNQQKRSFCVAGTGQGNSRERWAEVLTRCYYPLDPSRLSSAEFSGMIDLRSVGHINISRMTSQSHRLVRDRSHIARSSSQSLLFVIAVSGSFSFEHCGREGMVRQGDALLINTAEPYTTDCSNDYGNICFEVDFARLNNKLEHLEDACGQTIALDSSSKWFLQQTLNSLLDCDHDDEDTMVPIGNQLSGCVLDLAVTNIGRLYLNGAGESGGRYCKEVRRRIIAYIMENLSDSELSPSRIAAANKISISYLHKLFHSSGKSVNRWIWDKRLQQCMEKLSNPACLSRSVTDVAIEAGFSNLAHFSTRFRKRYGVTPREARKLSA